MPKLVKLVVAAVTGFVAGVLVAPKSGKETRKDIKKAAESARDKVLEETDKVKDVAEDGVKIAKHGAGIVADEAVAFGKSAKASAGRVAGEAVKLSGEAGDRARRVADGTKRTAESFVSDAKTKLK